MPASQPTPFPSSSPSQVQGPHPDASVQTSLPPNSETPTQPPPSAPHSAFSTQNSAFSPAPYSTITPKPIRWLWPARIPRGKITLLIGDPGSGKSLLTLDLAARLSRGTPFPEPTAPTASPDPSGLPRRDLSISEISNLKSKPTPQSPATPSPGPTDAPITPTPQPLCASVPSCLNASPHLLTAEDAPPDTLHPRLTAAHADLTKIHHLPSLTTLIPSDDPADNPLALLESAIQSIPDLALLVIDPITAFLGYTDRVISRNKTVLSALADLAARYNLALILTSRLNKAVPDGQPAHSFHRAVGSLAFTSAARAIHLIVAPSEPSYIDPDPRHDDAIAGLQKAPPAETPRIFIPIKINATHKPLPLAFYIENMRLTWPPITDPTALLADAALQETAIWLRAALTDGPITSDNIHKEARQNAIPHRTLIRAKRYLGIERTKAAFNGIWFWRLLGDYRRPANELDRIMVQLATPIDELVRTYRALQCG